MEKIPVFALCVGIDKYKWYPDASLRGCVNDSFNWIFILKQESKLAAPRITGGSPFVVVKERQLVNSIAIKEIIIDEMTVMLERATAEGGLFVYNHSSHGSQTPSKDSVEIEFDKLDEVLLTHDSVSKGEGWDRNTVIVDNELEYMFRRFPMCHKLISIDACHSGTMSRAFVGNFLTNFRHIPMPIPYPEMVAHACNSIELDKLIPPDLNCLNDIPIRFPLLHHKLATRDSYTTAFWSACLDKQTSADARIDGAYCGAFTYSILANQCKVLWGNDSNKLKESLTDSRIFCRQFVQTPQLEYNGKLV